MKWVKIATASAVLVILCLGINVSPVVADTEDEVTVTAYGYVVGMPEGFTAVYVDVGQVDLSWTKGEDAVNTMVRAAYNRLPSSVSDGYQVYYGDGDSFSDTALDYDEYLGTIYYAAWSENAAGIFSGNSVWDSVEGVPMLLFALIIIPLLLTIAMFSTRNMLLGFPCVIFWGVLGGYVYGESITPWGDWQYFLFFASMGMVIFSSIAMYALRERRDTIADVEMDEEGEEEGSFIDEKPTEPSRRVKGIRERAEQRKKRRSTSQDW